MTVVTPQTPRNTYNSTRFLRKVPTLINNKYKYKKKGTRLSSQTRPGRLRARSGSRLAQRGFRSGPRWERCLCSEKVPSVCRRFSTEKGINENAAEMMEPSRRCQEDKLGPRRRSEQSMKGVQKQGPRRKSEQYSFKKKIIKIHAQSREINKKQSRNFENKQQVPKTHQKGAKGSQ